MSQVALPLSGLRVLEFSHAIMGPACGLVLADLGAEVIKVEPPQGDPTRQLPGYGSGFFPFFNRNKKSLVIDAKSELSRKILDNLLATTDVLIENFAPATMDRLGLGYEALAARHPALIYCSLKGFQPGPYEQRPALDEVIQMMTGLAYMTGPEGRPLRAGTSILDIMGGTYGALGVLVALQERMRTARGQRVVSGLFETGAFLMGQHMAHAAITHEPIRPMNARTGAWAVYQLFTTIDNSQVFIAITSDRHWERFCQAFERSDFLADERLRTNSHRVAARDWLIPQLVSMFAGLALAEVMRRCQEAEIPVAPVGRPEELFDDPHLKESNALLPVQLFDGSQTRLPALPLRLENHRWCVRLQAPLKGEHTRPVLEGIGYSTAQVDDFFAQGVVL